jgi:hypothetical protein
MFCFGLLAMGISWLVAANYEPDDAHTEMLIHGVGIFAIGCILMAGGFWYALSFAGAFN